MFTTQEVVRYSKQLILDDLGAAGQQKLKHTKVLVVGAGGLGCPVLQYLNAVGVGTLGIVEFDVINATNLHRQILYGTSDIGKKKLDVAIEKLAAQNPFTSLVGHAVEMESVAALELIPDYDMVIDCCDNFKTRYIINDACVLLGKPLVYGSILGYQGQLAVFNNKGSKNLRDIFPHPPLPEDVPNCSENGVLGTVPGIIGLLMAQAAVNIILEKETFENQFLLFDTLTFEKTVLMI